MTRREVILQLSVLHRRCGVARDQLLQWYFATSRARPRELYDDFDALLKDIELRIISMELFADAPLLDADQEFLAESHEYMDQLLSLANQAGIVLSASAVSAELVGTR